MPEVLLGTGVYQWTSSGMINQLRQTFPKGVYLVVVEASLGGGPIARAILEFHIDPPGEETAASGFSFADMAAAVFATAGITGLVFRRREVAHAVRRL